ncbi:MAG: hypothetical protein LBG69_05260 [Zoogloeaceae bacterium]|jgi:general secretion pathway protein D|nr:hypothetical protein [Zoogloeaceae bacterium]
MMRPVQNTWHSWVSAFALACFLAPSALWAERSAPGGSAESASGASEIVASRTGKAPSSEGRRVAKAAARGDRGGEKSGRDAVQSAAPALPGDLYFRQITLDEAAQFIAKIGKTSIVVTSSVAGKVVSLYLRDVTVEGMVKNLCRAAGVWYRFDAQNGVYILMNAQEYQQDIAITRDESTKSFVLRHHNVVSIANAVAALFGDRVNLVEPVEEKPPIDLGGSRRGQTQAASGANGTNAYGNSDSAASGGRVSAYGGRAFVNQEGGGVTHYSGGLSARRGNVSGKAEDARKAIGSVSQSALEAALDVDSKSAASLDGAELLQSAAKQGAAINVTYNKQHNLLLARSSDDAALREIEALVTEMDKPPSQVFLEMRILEVELGNDFRSIFDVGKTSSAYTNAPVGQHAGDKPWFKDSGVNANLPDDAIGRNFYPRQSGLLGNFSELSGATAVWQYMNDTLRARLQLLESENRVNVLATPMLVAANNQEARLFIGDEQVLVVGASNNVYSGVMGSVYNTFTVDTEQRNVGQTLAILPRINADRTVTLTIDQDNSHVNVGGGTLPLPMPNGQIYHLPIDTVNTANLQVTAHARDGLTVAVGGMISQRVSDAEDKVPLLGNIPVLGMLFKKTARANARKQLVLLITPHILETPEESEALAREKEAAIKKLDGGNNSALRMRLNASRASMFNMEYGLAASPFSARKNSETAQEEKNPDVSAPQETESQP